MRRSKADFAPTWCRWRGSTCAAAQAASGCKAPPALCQEPSGSTPAGLCKISQRRWHCEILVPVAGVEPARPCGHGILSPGRLPIPPHRRSFFIITKAPCKIKLFSQLGKIVTYYTIWIKSVGYADCIKFRCPNCGFLVDKSKASGYNGLVLR